MASFSLAARVRQMVHDLIGFDLETLKRDITLTLLEEVRGLRRAIERLEDKIDSRVSLEVREVAHVSTHAPQVGEESDGRSCSIPDCGNPVRARGMCASHYMKWRYQEKKKESSSRLP